MLGIQIDRNAGTPIRDQLIHGFRDAIVRGELERGLVLPASRKLAQTLGVARATLLEAYEQLIAEGYLETVASARTVVASKEFGAAEGRRGVPPQGDAPRGAAGSRGAPTTMFGDACAHEVAIGVPVKRVKSSRVIDFSPSGTHVDDAFIEEWSRALWRRARAGMKADLAFADDRAGSLNLRSAIAEKVLPERGIVAKPDQVIITLGFMQAFDLLMRVHMRPETRLLSEDPCFGELREMIAFHQYKASYVPLDRDGMHVERLPDCGDTGAVAIVTPSYHFPTGATLSLPRRLQLLHWAHGNSCIIIEDDYNSEFVFAEHRMPSLKCLDTQGSVAYVSTFTKAMFPSIGIGYIVAPAHLSHVYANARRATSDPISTHLQEALADFIWDGSYQRHLRKVRSLYEEKRKVIASSLRRVFGTDIHIKSSSSGTQLVVTFRIDTSSKEILDATARAEVVIYSTQGWYTDNRDRREFVLGFGALAPKEIEKGVNRISTALKRNTTNKNS